MPASHHDQLLLIAARKPVAGQTKTRLGATIGMETAAQLYRAFLVDLVERFTANNRAFNLGWAYTPESHPFRETIAAIEDELACVPGNEATHYVRQVGEDWASRQAMLLRWGAEQGYASTILTASDSPQMTRAMVDAAFAALETSDVVLGRVHDGGYYLIGVRGFHDVVTGVPMSTASAADAVIARAQDRGLRVATVEPTFDVDVEQDLDLLATLCRRDPTAAPASRRALQDLNLYARGLTP